MALLPIAQNPLAIGTDRDDQVYHAMDFGCMSV
jgi:hypothetical protein